MIKVMFFRPMLYMGGTEIAILNLIRLLDKDKFEIYIGYTDDTSNERLMGRMAKHAKIINIKDNKIDIDVMINCSPYKSSTLYFNNVNFKKMFLWFHHFGSSDESIFNDDEYIKSLDKIITVSEATKNIMLKQEYAPKIQGKVEVIYNILDKTRLLEKAAEEYELDKAKDLNLITISRLSLDKGFARKIFIADELIKRNIDFKWFIVGSSYYEELENKIKSMFTKYGDRFVFLGMKQNPYRILKQCDYLVQLSDDETWGLTITEAKLLNIPCIISDFDVAYEQIEDMKNGIILSRSNTDSYKDRIDDILNHKEDFKANLKDFEYDINKMVEVWEQKLSEID